MARIKIVQDQLARKTHSPVLAGSPAAARRPHEAAAEFYGTLGDTITEYAQWKDKAIKHAKSMQGKDYATVAEREAIAIRMEIHTEGLSGIKYVDEFEKRFTERMSGISDKSSFDFLNNQERGVIYKQIRNKYVARLAEEGVKEWKIEGQKHINEEMEQLGSNAYLNPQKYETYLDKSLDVIRTGVKNGVLSGSKKSITKNIEQVYNVISEQVAQGFIDKVKNGELTAQKVRRTVEKATSHLPLDKQEKIREDLMGAEAYSLNMKYNRVVREDKIRRVTTARKSQKNAILLLQKMVKLESKGNLVQLDALSNEYLKLVGLGGLTPEKAMQLRASTEKMHKDIFGVTVMKLVMNEDNPEPLEAAVSYINKSLANAEIRHSEALPWLSRLHNLQNAKGGVSSARARIRVLDKVLAEYTHFDYERSVFDRVLKQTAETASRAREAHNHFNLLALDIGNDPAKLQSALDMTIKKYYGDIVSKRRRTIFALTGKSMLTSEAIDTAKDALRKEIMTGNLTNPEFKKSYSAEIANAEKLLRLAEQYDAIDTDSIDLDKILDPFDNDKIILGPLRPEFWEERELE